MVKNMNKKNQTDLLEGYKFLSRNHRTLHNQRRKYEWKVVFTILTLFVLTVSAFYTNNFKISNDHKYFVFVLVLLSFVSLIIISYKFLKLLHKANAKNKQIAEYSEDNLNKLINKKELIFENFQNMHPNFDSWAFRWQILTIILFALIAIGLIFLKVW